MQGTCNDNWCGEYRGLVGPASPFFTPALSAGITPKGWSLAETVIGTLVGLCLLLAVIVLVLPLALILTLLEALRDFLRLDLLPRQDQDGEGEQLTLVLPGTCSYAFWQIGMIQYLCEHFDTSNIKLAGVSSGAIAAVVLLHFEELAAEAASAVEPGESGRASSAAVRRRAQELFEFVESSTDLRWPLSFVGRLRKLLEAATSRILPQGVEAASSRLKIGVRRLALGMLPAMVPDVLSSFPGREELQEAVLASSNVWLVVSFLPWRWLPGTGALCSDGVNPFSLFCFYDYARQLWSRDCQTTAPSHMHGGILDRIYPIWNCTVMKALLCPKDRHIWVSPTVGGRLDVKNLLRFSNWFIGHQWQEGYSHAKDLDAAGYWDELTRRPGLREEQAIAQRVHYVICGHCVCSLGHWLDPQSILN
eukprot:s3130_g7.t1